MPNEEMLAKEYLVSRITVRQALASLEKDSYVVRQRGKGTFVSKKIGKPDQPLYSDNNCRPIGGCDDSRCRAGINT